MDFGVELLVHERRQKLDHVNPATRCAPARRVYLKSFQLTAEGVTSKLMPVFVLIDWLD